MMKRILQFISILITISVALLYLISSLSAYISTAKFPFLVFTSLIYLPIVILYGLLIIAWFRFNKRISILLLLLLFTGYQNLFTTVGLNIFHSWEWKKDKGAVRVMSWNVNGFDEVYKKNDTSGSVRRRMLSLIRQIQPDILCVQDFQESEPVGIKNEFVENVNDLFKAVNFKEVYYPFVYLYDGQNNYCNKIGVAIFSKLPIRDTGSIVLSEVLGERAGFVDVDVNSKKLRIYTAHFSSMSLWPNKEGEAGVNYLEGDSTKLKARGIYSKLKLYGKYHSQEADHLKTFLSQSQYPFIFCADLNSVPSSYVYHHLREGLKDAFLEKDYGIGGTYNRIFPKLRIDVFFHSKETEVNQFIRPVTNLSDHYPIIADIRWKQ